MWENGENDKCVLRGEKKLGIFDGTTTAFQDKRHSLATFFVIVWHYVLIRRAPRPDDSCWWVTNSLNSSLCCSTHWTLSPRSSKGESRAAVFPLILSNRTEPVTSPALKWCGGNADNRKSSSYGLSRLTQNPKCALLPSLYCVASGALQSALVWKLW